MRKTKLEHCIREHVFTQPLQPSTNVLKLLEMLYTNIKFLAKKLDHHTPHLDLRNRTLVSRFPFPMTRENGRRNYLFVDHIQDTYQPKLSFLHEAPVSYNQSL